MKILPLILTTSFYLHALPVPLSTPEPVGKYTNCLNAFEGTPYDYTGSSVIQVGLYAMGDGVTDVTSVLKQIASEAKAGDIIVFSPSRNYKISSSDALRFVLKRVCIAGNGANIIDAMTNKETTGLHPIDTNNDGLGDSFISGWKPFQHPDTTVTEAMLSIQCESGSKCNYSAVFDLNLKSGMDERSHTWADFDYINSLPYVGVGMYLQGASWSKFENIQITKRTAGIYATQTHASKFAGITFNGIMTDRGSPYLKGYKYDTANLTNNWVDVDGEWLHTHSKWNSAIRMKKVNGAVLERIMVNHGGTILTGGSVYNLIVKNSICNVSYENCMYLSSGGQNMVFNNTFQDVRDNVLFKGWGGRNLFAFNTANNTANASFYITSGMHDGKLNSGSAVVNNSISGAVNGGGFILRDNEIEPSSYVIAHNSMSSINGNMVIGVSVGSDHKIVNNILTGNKATHGVSLGYGTSVSQDLFLKDVYAVGNKITGSPGCTTCSVGLMTKNVVGANNYISGNTITNYTKATDGQVVANAASPTRLFRMAFNAPSNLFTVSKISGALGDSVEPDALQNSMHKFTPVVVITSQNSGSFNLGSTVGLEFLMGSGVNTRKTIFRGSLANIRLALTRMNMANVPTGNIITVTIMGSLKTEPDYLKIVRPPT